MTNLFPFPFLFLRKKKKEEKRRDRQQAVSVLSLFLISKLLIEEKGLSAEPLLRLKTKEEIDCGSRIMRKR